MKKLVIKKGAYPTIFGGFGFHNNEAILYPLIEKEHFDQILCKCYREMSPSFMRTLAGYPDWTYESMDSFAEYYERMQKWTDTPMYFAGAKGRVHFSDEEMRLHAEGVAERLEYLIKEKGVGHVRYYCYSNEMSSGTWGDLLDDLPTFKRYHEHLYRAFQSRGLDIGLLATDASDYSRWNTVDWAIENMNKITSAYCLHIYEIEHSIFDTGLYDFFYEKCSEMVEKASRADNKRFILGEIGMQKCTNGETHLTYQKGITVDVNRWLIDDFERSYYAIALADMVFAAINAGVYSMILWSYTDYPDPYSCRHSTKEGYAKEWGKIERFISGTTDAKYNKWGMFYWEDDGNYSPKEFYWCLAPIAKFFKRNSKVLDIETGDPLVHSAATLNRDGSVSIGIVNRNKQDVTLELDTVLFKQDVRVYEYDPRNVPFNRFADMQPIREVLPRDSAKVVIKAESVVFLTTDYEQKCAPVYACGVVIEGKKLLWNEVSDPKHCYYRVYADKSADFVPSIDNQIASTVDTSLPIEDASLCYKVLSVDIYGNV